MSDGRRKCLGFGTGLCLLIILPVSGCTRQAPRQAKVREVTHYGVQLTQEATPKQVAYVLFRAIREDFLAKSKADRNQALDVQFDLVAAGVLKTVNQGGYSADEYTDEVVRFWTPTVSHYVEDFETQWEKAEARMDVRGPTTNANGLQQCAVLMQVDNSHADRDPGASVVVVAWLAKDSGFWRVTHLGFDAPADPKGRREILSTPPGVRLGPPPGG